MKKEKGKINESLKASTLVTLLIIGAVIGSIYLFSVSDVIINKPIGVEQIPVDRRPTLVTGDANPGDNSGFFYLMIKNHSANPTDEYNANLTNTTGGNSDCYEWSDTGNTSPTGETPYGTTFDILFKVGITNEDGQWTSNSTWNEGYLWMLLTCADLSISANTNMTIIEIANTSTYAWYHFYLNNAGSGYTVTEGQSFNITSSKYYVQRIVA